MNIERLIAMANDIGAFFASEPDPAEGARGVANHLQRFWTPGMREQIIAYWRGGAPGFEGPLGRALELLDAAEKLTKSKCSPPL